ncbi:hypothetical protein TEA_003605 [Camellia sinensis var. sinensis]|uniref:GOLD domain-containing protein n=1 Tax=Camellia sinensis var. sinensis TaxID=542762 RepID=A0A4S4E2V9_CAMSN|nr:hypothetical protein TEA_003605 [Camellia sinensis var. sinensis]
MCRHCEGLSRNFKKIMDKGKKVSEELDQLRDEEKQLRATIRTLTNQLKKLAPEKTPTSLPSPEIKQLTSEEFDQLSARMHFFRHSIIRSLCEKSQVMEDLKPYIYTLAGDSRNDELVIIQQFLQDLSIARVDCPGLAYQWTYTYEDEEQPCLDEERCNKRSEHFGRYPDQTDNFGHKLAHAVLCVMEEHHPYVEALIDSKLPKWKEIWCNPTKHKLYLRGTSTFPRYPGLLNRRPWPCRRFSLKDQLNKWRKFARNSLLAYNGNYGHLVCEDRHQKLHCNLAIPRYPFSNETFVDESQYPNYQHGVSHESPVMGENDQEWNDEPPMRDGDDFYDQLSMKTWYLEFAMVATLAILWSIRGVIGIRFVIDREECFSHNVEYDGDTVHLSFVVIKSEGSWHYAPDGVDLVVKGPSGNQIHDFRDKTSEKFEFVAHQSGIHRFCFTNKSPYHETVDFDVHEAHFSYHDQHAKDEHLNPLLEQISKLEEALYNIQFEQHWIEAQTERQAIVNEQMSKRAIHKAFYESVALIGASVLQVYLLQRLFERKTGMSRV